MYQVLSLVIIGLGFTSLGVGSAIMGNKKEDPGSIIAFSNMALSFAIIGSLAGILYITLLTIQ